MEKFTSLQLIAYLSAEHVRTFLKTLKLQAVNRLGTPVACRNTYHTRRMTPIRVNQTEGSSRWNLVSLHDC